MAPPLSTALMQSRPLLNPDPDTIVAPLILCNPLFHKCRISDHLHLVFQWNIHVDIISKREVSRFTNVYTPPAQARMLRKHEGYPARAPDGTIMEIQGDACPGSTGESVGPWDFGNVHMCEGYAEWSAELTRTLQMALKAGLTIADVNMPQPSREELEVAVASESSWLNGRPLHTSVRRSLTAHRDGIRDKLEAFLVFVDGRIKSEGGKEGVFGSLREALGNALAGKEVGEYNGVLGGMVNKIVERIEEFIKYMEERVESTEAKSQRVDEVRDIINDALNGKEKRKRDYADEGDDQARKRVMLEDAKIKTEDDLTEEFAVPAKPRKKERKAKRVHPRKRDEKKTKNELAAALAKTANTDKRDAGARTSKEDEAAAGRHGMSKHRAEQYHHYGMGSDRLDSDHSSEQPASSTSTAKAKEAEAYSSSRTSLAPASSTALLRQKPNTPPPPYSEYSLGPQSARGEERITPRSSMPDQTPQSSPPNAESRNNSPVSTWSDNSTAPKQMCSAARILEKIKNAGKRQAENAAAKESERTSTTSTSVATSATLFTRTDTAMENTSSSQSTHSRSEISLPRRRSMTPHQPNEQPEPETEPEEEEDEDSLFLPQTTVRKPQQATFDMDFSQHGAKSPHKEVDHEHETEHEHEHENENENEPEHEDEHEHEHEPEVEPEAEAEYADDNSFLPESPARTPARESSYDMELPPQPKQAKTPLPEVEQDHTIVPPSPPLVAQSPPPNQRQSSYDLELPPPPTEKKVRLGSSRMPIDIDLDSDTEPSSSTPISCKPCPTLSPRAIEIKDEPNTPSSTTSNPYIEIKDEDDDIVVSGTRTPHSVVKKEKRVKKEVVEVGHGGHGGNDGSGDADGEILMSSRDEWTRRVKEKKTGGLGGGRRGGW